MPIQAPQAFNTESLSAAIGPLWAGQQQRAALDESDTQQDWTRAQTSKSMQDQDIARQKLPGELEQQVATLESTRANTEGTVSQTKERNQKLDQTKYTAFANDLSVFQPTQDNLADAVRLSEIAKKHDMDTADPRIQATIEILKQGPEMFAKFQQQLAENTPEARRKRAEDQRTAEREDARDAAANLRSAGNNAASIESARLAADSRERVAQLRQEVTQAALTIDKELVQLVAIINDPKQDPAIRQNAQARAKMLQEYKLGIATAVQQGKAEQLQMLLGKLPANPQVGSSFTPQTATPAAGGGDIAAKVQAAGQKYEPEKYDYRIGPNGEVQRKAK